jgi:class 3 adenylate cyclase
VRLAGSDHYADIRVTVGRRYSYFVEVKIGYPATVLRHDIGLKYGHPTPSTGAASRLVLVVDPRDYADWPSLHAELRAAVSAHLELEIWDEERMLRMLNERFNLNLPSLTEHDLLTLRLAIETTKGRHAFGECEEHVFYDNPIGASLLWHFGYWRLQQLRETYDMSPRDILPPGRYSQVVCIIADLSNFSSFVRDSSSEMVRFSLTSFYSKCRYQIINRGGFLYQFVGDEVIGLFGVPDRREHYLGDAVEVARSLLDIGTSVMTEWQHLMDRDQGTCGAHIGMAVGDIEILSLRPFSRVHLGAVGDPINIAARLMSKASAGEILISNSLYSKLDEPFRNGFEELDQPLELRNVGKIRAWSYLGAEVPETD